MGGHIGSSPLSVLWVKAPFFSTFKARYHLPAGRSVNSSAGVWRSAVKVPLAEVCALILWWVIYGEWSTCFYSLWKFFCHCFEHLGAMLTTASCCKSLRCWPHYKKLLSMISVLYCDIYKINSLWLHTSQWGTGFLQGWPQRSFLSLLSVLSLSGCSQSCPMNLMLKGSNRPVSKRAFVVRPLHHRGKPFLHEVNSVTGLELSIMQKILWRDNKKHNNECLRLFTGLLGLMFSFILTPTTFIMLDVII